MKRFYIVLLTVLFLCSCSSLRMNYVERDDWAPDVKTAINDFIDMYGKGSDQYNPNSYVVFDFDNTVSIFDMCEQFLIYQAQVMGYGFSPDELPYILASGLGDMDKDLSHFGYGNGSYKDWIYDITVAYSYLYNKYGPFTPFGVDVGTGTTIQSDPMWAEFIAKMMNLYNLIGDNESTFVSYPWITYWLTGMTEQEVYQLSRKAFSKYRLVDSCRKSIKTSSEISSKVGVTEYSYVEGIQISENMQELWQKLSCAGIDIWVCTASQCDIIRAAIDEFGLHDYCCGLIGMTPAVVDDRISFSYDFKTGYCWYSQKEGWNRGYVASETMIQGIGKVVSIQNICERQYGCGPLAGFMDSTGDFNFCTEFSSLKLVVCLNRADRKVSDGGSLIAELAMYQRDNLGYNLKMANKNGDTFYVLQGRNENGKRSFQSSNRTLKLGETEDILFRDWKNQALYDYMVENRMTTEEVLNGFCLKTEESQDNNKLGFAYGFLTEYSGYHTK